MMTASSLTFYVSGMGAQKPLLRYDVLWLGCLLVSCHDLINLLRIV